MLYVEHFISDNNRMGSSSYVIHHTISDDYVSLPGSILSFLVVFFKYRLRVAWQPYYYEKYGVSEVVFPLFRSM